LLIIWLWFVWYFHFGLAFDVLVCCIIDSVYVSNQSIVFQHEFQMINDIIPYFLGPKGPIIFFYNVTLKAQNFGELAKIV